MKRDMFEGSDLQSTIDSRSVYASAMSAVFETDFAKIKKDVFWDNNINNFSDILFKI
jgi:uncharacterized protein (DUF1501 family)